MLNRKLLESEIAGSKAALKAHENGIEIHRIVAKAFQKELDKLPKEEIKDENAKK